MKKMIFSVMGYRRISLCLRNESKMQVAGRASLSWVFKER